MDWEDLECFDSRKLPPLSKEWIFLKIIQPSMLAGEPVVMIVKIMKYHDMVDCPIFR